MNLEDYTPNQLRLEVRSLRDEIGQLQRWLAMMIEDLDSDGYYELSPHIRYWWENGGSEIARNVHQECAIPREDKPTTKGSEESDEPVWSLTCCGSESGVHLIGCQSEDALAGRIHRPSEKNSEF